jgi:hypothetical protein
MESASLMRQSLQAAVKLFGMSYQRQQSVHQFAVN